MKLSTVVATFAGAVVVAVVGWFAGGLLRDATAPAYDTAVGIVDADAGAVVATASPTPSPTLVASPTTPEATGSPSPTPEETRASIICEGAPPSSDCDCDLQDGEWVWVCDIEGSPTSSPPTSPDESPLLDRR